MFLLDLATLPMDFVAETRYGLNDLREAQHQSGTQAQSGSSEHVVLGFTLFCPAKFELPASVLPLPAVSVVNFQSG